VKVLEGLLDYGSGEVLEGRSEEVKKAILNMLLSSAPSLASRMLNAMILPEQTALSQPDAQEQALFQDFVIDSSSNLDPILPSWPAEAIFPAEAYNLHLPDCANLHHESSGIWQEATALPLPPPQLLLPLPSVVIKQCYGLDQSVDDGLILAIYQNFTSSHSADR